MATNWLLVVMLSITCTQQQMTIYSAVDGLNVRTVIGMQLVLLLISLAADLYPSFTSNQHHFICGGSRDLHINAQYFREWNWRCVMTFILRWWVFIQTENAHTLVQRRIHSPSIPTPPPPFLELPIHIIFAYICHFTCHSLSGSLTVFPVVSNHMCIYSALTMNQAESI